MADVTISSLPLGIPSGNSIIPFSQGGQTYSTYIAQLSSLPFIPKAWVSFNGSSGTTVDSEFRCSIFDSYNINKVVRTSTGVYFIYFATLMNNSNYAIVGTPGDSVYRAVGLTKSTVTTTSFRINTFDTGGYNQTNCGFINVVIFGN